MALAVLLQALALLLAEPARAAPGGGDGASAGGSRICRAATDDGHAPLAGFHRCDLCPPGGCEGDALAPEPIAATPPRAATLAAGPTAGVALPPASGTFSWSSRAPPAR